FEPPPFSVTEPALARLFDHWRAILHGGPVPLRRDFDPLDLPYILGRIMLVELRQSPRHWFVRVHGTEIARRIGVELTGRALDGLPPEFREPAVARFDIVARTGLPHRTATQMISDHRRLRYEALILPLSRDGGAIDMLLCGINFFGGPKKAL
ncbi:MAG: PAS domain-containing protein, partial [Stellaceae bacterium]